VARQAFRHCLEASNSTKKPRVCDGVYLAETQTTRSGPVDRHPDTGETVKSRYIYIQRGTETRRSPVALCRTRDKRMSLLSGHHRIMEAAEAALVMMVLEEGWFVLGQFRSRQLSRS
jgi:hypothetical protein